jgi:hypothetical protein
VVILVTGSTCGTGISKALITIMALSSGGWGRLPELYSNVCTSLRESDVPRMEQSQAVTTFLKK